MQDRPNLLLIHADQHRWDCLGAYGNRQIRTPNLDALAAEGVVYENSFCPHPICTPSRYSLLSGLYIHQHLGLTNRSTLPTGLPTLPRQLRAQGWRTAAVGKMHFTPTYLDVGFERMRLAEQCGDGRYDDDYHRWLAAEGLCDTLDLIDQVAEYRRRAPEAYWRTCGALRSDLDEAHHSTTWVGDRAVEELAGWEGGGNFLMVGFVKPHHPFDPPAPWDAMYDPAALAPLPGWTAELQHGDDGRGYFPCRELTEEQLRRVMAMYYASISQIDHHVGRMLDHLRGRGLLDDTVVVYTSDHGDYLGYHHRLLKSYRMLEPVVRVPLLVRFPGGRDGGSRDPRLVNNVDLAPTLLAALGAPVPATMTGLDLTDPDAAAEFVFAEYKDEYMVRTRTTKLLMHRREDDSLFFDLEADPLELDDHFHDPARRDEIDRLRAALVRWRMFDARPFNHLDPAARQCAADNVPERPNMLEDYFRKRMAAARPEGMWDA